MRESKIFPLVYIFLLGGGLCSSTARVSVRLVDQVDIDVPGVSTCNDSEILSYTNLFAEWARASSGNVKISACTHGYSLVTTTTSFPTSSPTTSLVTGTSTTLIPTIPPSSTFSTTSTTFSSTTGSVTTSTGKTPTVTSTVPTSVPATTTKTMSLSVTTTKRPDTTVTTAVPVTTTTLPITTTVSTTLQTTTASSTCPAIHPPASGSYTDKERNAYCAEAEGTGSYCKCAQLKAGQVCQQVQHGSGLKCSCAAMCTRRLLELSTQYTKTTVITFVLSNIAESVDSLLSVLSSGSTAFTMTAFDYTQGSSSGETTSSGGTISALIDFVSSSRRLLEADATSALSTAVSESLSELVGPSLAGTFSINTVITGLVANVSIAVSTALASNQVVVSQFLVQDAAKSTDGRLPQLVTAKSSVPVSYASGYVPIVWSSPDAATSTALNVLPYVIAGVVLVLLVAFILGWKYRFVLSSWWSNLLEPARSVWMGSSGAMPAFATQFERGKSEVASTPDTATNLDQDEFEDLFVRQQIK